MDQISKDDIIDRVEKYIIKLHQNNEQLLQYNKYIEKHLRDVVFGLGASREVFRDLRKIVGCKDGESLQLAVKQLVEYNKNAKIKIAKLESVLQDKTHET